MSKILKYDEFILEFLDSDFLYRFGRALGGTLDKSIDTEEIENTAEEEGEEEPPGSQAESPIGFGKPRVQTYQISTEEYENYGASLGIRNKGDNADINQPSSGPIGNIVNSAYANLNVSTRGIRGTGRGNLGCAAAVSIIFYRATGYSLSGGKQITLSTQSIYDDLEQKSKEPGSNWKMIKDWRNSYEPGDIIITKRGSRAGHVGVVVDGGNIISNSSGGFLGDERGQIEQNYTIDSWESVAKRNPSGTALFRYNGPYKSSWN